MGQEHIIKEVLRAKRILDNDPPKPQSTVVFVYEGTRSQYDAFHRELKDTADWEPGSVDVSVRYSLVKRPRWQGLRRPHITSYLISNGPAWL